MKVFFRASLIALFAVLSLAGCDSLGIRNILAPDQVPQSAKDEPRVVGTPPPVTPDTPWPRLGDVPFKPKDFSPPPVYNHYMDELTDDRTSAASSKAAVEQEPLSPSINGLNPPQLPKE